MTKSTLLILYNGTHTVEPASFSTQCTEGGIAIKFSSKSLTKYVLTDGAQYLKLEQKNKIMLK